MALKRHIIVPPDRHPSSSLKSPPIEYSLLSEYASAAMTTWLTNPHVLARRTILQSPIARSPYDLGLQPRSQRAPMQGTYGPHQDRERLLCLCK